MYSKILEVLNAKSSLAYYLLGAFCTDGNICIDISTNAAKCSLSSNDDDWLHLIHNAIGNDGAVRKRKDGRHELWLYNKEVYNWFNENGCTPAKSLNLSCPIIPEQYLPDFLRGCIDGDGSIVISSYLKNGKRYPKITCYLCGSSLSFLKDIEQILINKGIKSSFVYKKNSPNDKIKYKHPHYRVFMNDSKARAFLNWIYYPGNPLSMPRKQKLAIDILKKFEVSPHEN